LLKIHNFQEQLRWGEEQSCEGFWDAVYRKAFPTMLNHMQCLGSSDNQRMGIDRVIQLSNGKTLYIEEKKRRGVYPDILLEYVSVDRTGAPGWIEKDLIVDYLAYAFIPNKRCYLYSYPLLRRAWINYKDSWLKTYRTIKAQNEGYATLSVAIPIDVLKQSVAVASIIDVSDEYSEGGYYGSN